MGRSVLHTVSHAMSNVDTSHIIIERCTDRQIFKKKFLLIANPEMADGYFACFIFKPNITCEIET